MGYISLAERLRRHRILINNGINDPVIAERMATVGYTPENMQKAEQLLQEVEEAINQNRTEHDEYNEALNKRQEAKGTFHDDYMRDLQFARIAWRNKPEILSRIDASGSREIGQAKYLEQAKNFYSSIAKDATLLEALAVYGYTAELVNNRMVSLENLYKLMEEVERESGDAQQQIKVRDQRFDELDDWVSVYKQVARLVFEDDPQYLEKLGIVVRS